MFQLTLLREGVRSAGLIDWTASSRIRPNEPNMLTVGAQDSHFVLFINGEYVGEARESELSHGEVGLAAGLQNAGDGKIFESYDFQLRVP